VTSADVGFVFSSPCLWIERLQSVRGYCKSKGCASPSGQAVAQLYLLLKEGFATSVVARTGRLSTIDDEAAAILAVKHLAAG
jgi:hypothetical protein